MSASGTAYYTERRVDGEKLKKIRKYDKKTRKVEEFNESGKNLGRNEIKKRKN